MHATELRNATIALQRRQGAATRLDPGPGPSRGLPPAERWIVAIELVRSRAVRNVKALVRYFTADVSIHPARPVRCSSG